MDIEWARELSIGNEIIDSEHRDLIGLTNNVVHAIGARDCTALMGAFEALENRLQAHFANEERIACAAGFDFFGHKPAQQHSLKELRHMRDELMSKDGVWSDGAVEHFARYLEKWVIDGHIGGLDMKMKPVLQSRPYDFNPV